jgi:hypothetical protein
MGLGPLVGEGSNDYHQKVGTREVEAVGRARASSGVVSVDPDWERTATPAQRESRRRESLAREKKADQELDRTLSGEVRAKYKIEITFVGPDETGYKGRTMNGPNRLGISIWESGKRFHGGGDELMYWCKDNRPGEDGGCWSPISSDYIRGGVAVCPSCNKMSNAELLTNMRIGNITTQNLSKELVKMFHSLSCNADIYVKYHKTDIHYVAMERDKGPEVAARLKGMHIYPLRNILKDTASGADLGRRFFTFLTS